jgi:hypothetical protein
MAALVDLGSTFAPLHPHYIYAVPRALDGGLPPFNVTNCQTCPGLYRAMVIVHERLQGLGADATVPPGLATSLSRAIAGTDG